ncbi:MAG TPA: FadR/GntR family transcriptional regulator [Verrucomicrobiae bacterium]|nr:FadR/GntR family transcriptional regulator [Verrucomicrobiae bacterium]
MPSELRVQRNSLAQQVVDRVRALIADGTYPIGERLPAEGPLGEAFGVGRSTLREAMRVLASRGIVDVRHGDGTFIAAGALHEPFEERLGRAGLRDLYEARLVLELPLAELAAQRRTSRDVATMRKALKTRAAAAKRGDVDAYGNADFDFHLAVARAAKNAALFDMYAAFVDVAKPALGTMIDARYIQNERDTLHDALCDAIAAGDRSKARRLVRSHLQGSHENMESNRTW